MFKLEILGLDKLSGKLTGDTVKKPLDDGVKKITYALESEVKQATPVDTGVLRSGIFSNITPSTSLVGTQVQYAPFIEYGTEKMEARHVEGGGRVYGEGMFAYGLKKLMEKMGNFINDMRLKIESKWGE